MRALIDMCATGMLVKQSLFDSLKHETVDIPKAKTWTSGVGTLTTKKKIRIDDCKM